MIGSALHAPMGDVGSPVLHFPHCLLPSGRARDRRQRAHGRLSGRRRAGGPSLLALLLRLRWAHAAGGAPGGRLRPPAWAGSGGPLFAGRLLIGLGASVTFVGALKVAAVWFPPRWFGTVSALTSTMGVLGALAATAPFAFLAGAVGWRRGGVL